MHRIGKCTICKETVLVTQKERERVDNLPLDKRALYNLCQEMFGKSEGSFLLMLTILKKLTGQSFNSNFELFNYLEKHLNKEDVLELMILDIETQRAEKKGRDE